jgi:hypothetical protein
MMRRIQAKKKTTGATLYQKRLVWFSVPTQIILCEGKKERKKNAKADGTQQKKNIRRCWLVLGFFSSTFEWYVLFSITFY